MRLSIRYARMFLSILRSTTRKDWRIFAGRIGTQIEADSLSLLNTFTDQKFLDENGFTKQNVLAMFVPNSYEFFWNTSAEKFRNKMAQGIPKILDGRAFGKSKEIKSDTNSGFYSGFHRA